MRVQRLIWLVCVLLCVGSSANAYTSHGSASLTPASLKEVNVADAAGGALSAMQVKEALRRIRAGVRDEPETAAASVCGAGGVTYKNKCVCMPGFGGLDCSKPVCKDKCNHHGKCVEGQCVCDLGYVGVACESIGCTNSCSGRGLCHLGSAGAECFCFVGYAGEDCSKRACPDCGDHGTCSDAGVCYCENGWTGPTCSQKVCPNACSGRGTCNAQTGQCSCQPGFSGDDCSGTQCPDDCHQNGVCDLATGVCTCDPGYFGSSCSPKECSPDCSQHGTCAVDQKTGRGKCTCKPGWKGADCQTQECEPEWTGPRCDERQCGFNCGGSNQGVCNKETWQCSCLPGWTGSYCRTRSCPDNCNSHGVCVDGTCQCEAGWNGKSCATPNCLKDCHGNGVCTGGECYCFDGFEGEDCSYKIGQAPPQHKDAKFKAVKDEDHTAESNLPPPHVSKTLQCNPACSEHGVCTMDTDTALISCFCADGWGGVSCDVPITVGGGVVQTGFVKQRTDGSAGGKGAVVVDVDDAAQKWLKQMAEDA